jgi:predicted porin
MKKNKIMVLAILFILNIGAYAQSPRTIDNQTNAWYMYMGNHKLNDKWELHTLYHFRRTNLGQDWQQSLARVGLNYHVAPGLVASAGADWVVSYPYGKQPISYNTTEYTAWEAIFLRHQVGRLNFTHRYRLEQRFIEKDNYDSTAAEWQKTETTYKDRFRYMLTVDIPLNHAKMQDKTWFLSANDELFIGMGRNQGKNLLEQNRIYAGIGYRFNKDCNLQLGYMNQKIIKADAIHMENNHTLLLGAAYNLDFTHKKS